MVFEGQAIGAVGESIGELVFTTGMVGYMETLTDPSYAGQIIMQTFPLIGNYGVIPEDFEGDCFARGYVVNFAASPPTSAVNMNWTAFSGAGASAASAGWTPGR